MGKLDQLECWLLSSNMATWRGMLVDKFQMPVSETLHLLKSNWYTVQNVLKHRSIFIYVQCMNCHGFNAQMPLSAHFNWAHNNLNPELQLTVPPLAEDSSLVVYIKCLDQHMPSWYNHYSNQANSNITHRSPYTQDIAGNALQIVRV